ncbi:hypothetical protein CDAR_371481 [Caerostris darwini]|uniref:Uncharacterized protein n=1 Tax=Caerostris darwini TaxID=1538125 RepID=A0AAV4X9Z7_9ARAC|nr:hypothetical protein CDAR_371481 [Caerostris darwini]
MHISHFDTGIKALAFFLSKSKKLFEFRKILSKVNVLQEEGYSTLEKRTNLSQKPQQQQQTTTKQEHVPSCEKSRKRGSEPNQRKGVPLSTLHSQIAGSLLMSVLDIFLPFEVRPSGHPMGIMRI